MLVCRYLEKAKEYGFIAFYSPTDLRRVIDGDIVVRIYNGCVFLDASNYTYDAGKNNTDLDFLYDMIKDGILEKVEA